MAGIVPLTIGTLAGIAGGDAVETGAAVSSQRLYNRIYRGRHPLGSSYPEGAIPVRPKRLQDLFDKEYLDDMQRRGPKRLKVQSDGKHGYGMAFSNTINGIKTENLPVGVFNWNRVDLPPLQDDSNEINRRENNIFLKGVKIHREWHGQIYSTTPNVATSYIGPMKINWALIQFNCKLDNSQEGAELAKMVDVQSRFFVQKNSSDVHYTGFGKYNWLTANTTEAYNINHNDGKLYTHNDYRVLARRSFFIEQRQPITASSIPQKAKTTVKLKEYFKTPQRIYLEDPINVGTWQHPMYEIWWAAPISPVHIPTVGATPTQIATIHKNTVYFSDLKI